MRLIDIKTLREFWNKHPDAQEKLTQWYQTAKMANWQNLQEVRRTYPHADAVTITGSGRTKIATVFNIAGNKYRLITAIHYNRQIIFLMMVLTHKEYSTDRWKDVL